jgi:hydrogenase/urease accessory protein HupE
MFSMNDFVLYFKMGLKHVLDFSAYDHILFLIVLAVVFNFKQWRKVMWLVTLFTIGHSITLALSAYEVLKIRMDLIEFLIPLTIIITAIINILTAKKSPTGKENINLVFALIFGLIHGLGFSNYFKMIVGKEEDKLIPLVEFALGIEASQIIIVFGILIIGTTLQNLFRVSRRDWILVCSSIVIGFSCPIMIERIFW